MFLRIEEIANEILAHKEREKEIEKEKNEMETRLNDLKVINDALQRQIEDMKMVRSFSPLFDCFY